MEKEILYDVKELLTNQQLSSSYKSLHVTRILQRMVNLRNVLKYGKEQYRNWFRVKLRHIRVIVEYKTK